MEDDVARKDTRKDFFISYAHQDWQWAKWISQQLEEGGYTTILPGRDFLPGRNVSLEMDIATRARRTIAVLSPYYLASRFTKAEWAAAFYQDPTGANGQLLPVRVLPCTVEGMLASLIYIDLVGQEAGDKARNILLAGVQQTPRKLKPAVFPLEKLPLDQQTVRRQQLRFTAEFPSIWNVPYRSHPLFADRKDVLQRIYEGLRSLSAEFALAPQAFSGPGGIGKTRFATEYAFHYRSEYDAVLWVNAESRDILLTQFVALADELHLPEKDMQDQPRVRAAVTRWLTEHERWLLIIDNADDIDMVQEFIPPTGRGHILLTSRARAMGAVAHRIVLDPMLPDDGALFLLCRATILEPADVLASANEEDRNEALALTQLMGGLPLALDQVGAYIEETMCGVSGYIEVYRTHARELLNERGEVVVDHPDPVSTTWRLAFEHIDKRKAAAELLRLCAFLYPDAIPEEIVFHAEGLADGDGAHQLIVADRYELDQAARELIKSSLIQRNDKTKMFTIHRLVQDALKNYWMSRESLPLWATQAIRAVQRTFPVGEAISWQQGQRFLPQVFACKNILDVYGLNFVEAAQLFERAAQYLALRAEYDQAEALYQKALAVYQHCLGEQDLAVADCAAHYADLLQKMRRTHDAEAYEQLAENIRLAQSG